MAGHQKPTDEELERAFSHNPPTAEQVAKYSGIRHAMLQLAKIMRDVTPCCSEQTIALRRLEESMFYANAAIARHRDGC